MKFTSYTLTLLLILPLFLLSSCSEEDTALLSVDQFQSELAVKHGDVINQAVPMVLNSEQLSMFTGVDYIETSKKDGGQFLAFMIEQHMVKKPILDHMPLDQQFEGFEEHLDFAMVMTIDELNSRKKASFIPIIIRILGGKCVSVAGGWDQCSFSFNSRECNPFALDGCGVGPGDGDIPDDDPIILDPTGGN